jgi:DNA-directed RNA polymerase subunit RPC12/RpoP
MSRTNMDDFKKPDGHIDWNAYHEAEVQAGERCMRCRSNIFSFNLFSEDKSRGPRLCGSCKVMDQDEGEITHDDFIRCPHCGHQDRITDWDCDYGREKYEEGEHEVYCRECDKEFEITTHVSYSYTSPPMKKDE